MQHGSNETAVYPPGSTPPKSAARIRAVLKSVHQACESPAQGPLRHGLGKADWIALQTFFGLDRYWLDQLLVALSEQNIPFQLRHGTKRVTVEVLFPDLKQAELVDDELRPHRRRGLAIHFRRMHAQATERKRQAASAKRLACGLAAATFGFSFGIHLGAVWMMCESYRGPEYLIGTGLATACLGLLVVALVGIVPFLGKKIGVLARKLRLKRWIEDVF